MKKTILTASFLFMAFAIVSAQEFNGNITIKGMPKSQALHYSEPVQLFKAFKENKYPIIFSLNAKSDQIIVFDMVTTVKMNGKIISNTSRKNWPWLPGDMYVPVEAFDFIPALQNQSKRTRTGRFELPGDTFEILLEMQPTGEATGRIESFKFTVTR